MDSIKDNECKMKDKIQDFAQQITYLKDQQKEEKKQGEEVKF